MRFSRIELTNWKNFQHVEVDLPNRVFLVGPNASGKSNFLDALRFLRDLARPGGGLQNACEARGGVSKIRCLSARRPSGVSINVELEDEHDSWRYEVAFTQDTKYPVPGTPKLIREIVEKNGEIILNRPNEEDTADSLRLTQTALEQVNFNQKFRDVVEFFSNISYLHLVPQIVRSGTLSNDPNVPDIFGGQFLERVASAPANTRKARLNRILEYLQLAVPQLQDLRLSRDQRGVPHLEVLYQHWRPNAGRQDESQLSDGTLRLMALLWLLDEGIGTLLMEEPELSLHVGIVKRLAGIIHRANRKKRQVFISTHSADFLSYPGISGHELLLFQPGHEGTEIRTAVHIEKIRKLLETGLPVSDVVLPVTEPPDVWQVELS